MNEAEYYENPDFWTAEKYLQTESEVLRLRACSNLIPSPVKSLLDVGTGNGSFLRFLEDQQRDIHLVGLERSETATQRAVCKAEIRIGSVDQLPFEDQSFDLVSAMEVIEHFPYEVYEKALQEIARVARDYIIIGVPYKEPDNRVRCPYCGCKFHPHYHMRRFDERVLVGLFDNFEVVQTVKQVLFEDYVYANEIRQIYRTVFRKEIPYPPTALCPQCGFHETDSVSSKSGSPSMPRKVLNTVKKILPRSQRPTNISVLYRRKR